MRFGSSGRRAGSARREVVHDGDAQSQLPMLLRCSDWRRAPRASWKSAKIGISFGGLKAVQQFSMRLPAGGLHGLIGPNGAGKTTVFNLLTGVYQHRWRANDARRARISLGLKPHRGCGGRDRAHVSEYSPVSRAERARQRAAGRPVADAARAWPTTLLRTRRYLGEEDAIEGARRSSCSDCLICRTAPREPADCLSYGHQRHLEIVRALATGPKVLLLDEPAAGLNSQEKRELAESIRQIRDRFGVAILLIEHDMGLVMDICEQITVLDHGVTIAEGAGSDSKRSEGDRGVFGNAFRPAKLAARTAENR